MLTEARKLYLIEEVLRTDDEQTLFALEAVLKKPTLQQNNSNRPFYSLSGIWSKEEAEEIEQAITENFEQVNINDWK